jgi:glutamate-1-semialdehyde 2,1-aminomutase
LTARPRIREAQPVRTEEVAVVESTVDRGRLKELMAREEARFVREHPRSHQLFERGKANLLAGVPMPWMSEWAGPFPVFVA